MDDTNDKMSETVDCTNISAGVPSSDSLLNADAVRLERYNIQDKTMFSNRSSIESSLSFPSQEPSLLDELRTSLENKTLMKSRPHRNVSVDFSLSSSPGSHNSTLDANDTNVVVPKGRKLNLFSRLKKKEVNINFTLGNESSSTVENEQSSDTSINLSRNVAAMPGFKRPALKRVSVRFDCTDSSVNDDSKASLDQVSMLEDSKPITRKIAKLRSTRSGGPRKVNVDFTLNDTQASEVLTNDSGSVSLSVPEESLNPLESKHFTSKQSGMLSVCSDDVPESNHGHSLDPIVLGASAQTSICEGEQLIRDDCNKPGSSENADVPLASEIPRSHNNLEDSSMSVDISKISVAKTEFKRLKSQKEENQSALTNSDSFNSDDPVLPCFIHDEQSINQEPSKNLKIGDADTGESCPSGTDVVGLFQTKEQHRMEKSNLNSTNAGASCKSVESDLALSMDTSKITVAKTKLKRPRSRKEVSVKFDCEASSSLGSGIESSLNVENNQSINPETFNNLAPEGNVLAGQLFASSVSGGEARTILEGKKQRSCKKSSLNFAGAEESSISVDNISSMDVSKLTVDKTEFKRLRSQRVSVKFDCSDLSSDETETRDKSEIINDTTFTRRAQASGLRGSKAPNKNVTVNFSLGSLDRTGAPVETTPSNHELSAREMSCSSVVLPTNKETPEDVDHRSGERDFPKQSLVPSGTPRVLDDVGKACMKQRSCNKSSLNFVSAEAPCIPVDNSCVDVSQLTVAKTEFKRLRSQRVSVQFDCNVSSDETETRDGSEPINGTTFIGRQSTQASGWWRSEVPNEKVTMDLSLGSLGRTGESVETAPSESESDSSGSELSVRDKSRSRVVLSANKDTPKDVDCEIDEGDFPKLLSETSRKLDHAVEKAFSKFLEHKKTDDPSLLMLGERTVMGCQENITDQNDELISYHPANCESKNDSASDFSNTFNKQSETRFSEDNMSLAISLEGSDERTETSLSYPAESSSSIENEQHNDSSVNLSRNVSSKPGLKRPASKRVSVKFDCFDSSVSDVSKTSLDQVSVLDDSKPKTRKVAKLRSTRSGGPRKVNVDFTLNDTQASEVLTNDSGSVSLSVPEDSLNPLEIKYLRSEQSGMPSVCSGDAPQINSLNHEHSLDSVCLGASAQTSIGEEKRMVTNDCCKPGLSENAEASVANETEKMILEVSSCGISDVSMSLTKAGHAGESCKENRIENIDFTTSGIRTSSNQMDSEGQSISKSSMHPLEKKSLRRAKISIPCSSSDSTADRIEARDSNAANNSQTPTSHQENMDEVAQACAVNTTYTLEVDGQVSSHSAKLDHDQSGLAESSAQPLKSTPEEMPAKESSSLDMVGARIVLRKKNIHPKGVDVDFTLSDTPLSESGASKYSTIVLEKHNNPLTRKGSRSRRISVAFPSQSRTLTNDKSTFTLEVGDSCIVDNSEPPSSDFIADKNEVVMDETRTVTMNVPQSLSDDMTSATPVRVLVNESPNTVSDEPEFSNISRADIIIQNVPESVCATKHGTTKSPDAKSLAGGPPVIGSRVPSADQNQSHETNCTDEQLNLVVTLGDLDIGPESSVDDVSGAKLSNKSEILNSNKKCTVSSIENRQQEYQKDADLMPTEVSPKQVSPPENFSVHMLSKESVHTQSFSLLKVKALETSNQPADIGKDISANMLPSVHEIINVDAIDPPPSCKSSLDASKLVESSRQDQPGPFVNDNARQTVRPSHEESSAQITEEHNRDQRNREVPVLNTGDHDGVLNLVATSTSSQTRPSTSRDGLNRVNENPVSNDCGSAGVETVPPSSSDVSSVLPAKNGEVPRRIQPSDNDSLGTLKSKGGCNLPHPKSILVDTVNRQTPAGKNRKSKRKSISFKPAVQNLYHSPPDYHCNGSNQNLSASTSGQKGEGYDEFSRIQMTSEISEIQTSMRVTRSKRHYSSTPLPKSKKRCVPSKDMDFTLRREAKLDDEIFAKPVTSAGLANNEFLVPPPPLFAAKPSTRLSSGEPRPDSPLNAVGPAEPSPKDEKENQASGGDSSSSEKTSVDLSYENSLNISAIPKDKTDPRRDNVFHSTPLHRTKTSKTKSKKKCSSGVPHSIELGVDRNLVNDRSVNTSRKLRSRSRQESFLSEPEGSSRSRDSDNSETRSRSRSSRSRSDSQTESLQGSPHVSARRFDEESSNDYSSPSRISIKDDTVLSSQATSHSRARGFTSRSSRSSYMTRESSLMSYDSHRKLPSRRLFTHDALGDEENTDDLSNKEASGSTSGTTSISKSSNILVAEEPSTKHTDLLDENDYEVAALSSPQPPGSSRDDSVTSSGSGAGSVASYIVPHESLKSQINSLRRISRASSVSSDGSEVSLSRKDPHLRPKNGQSTSRSGEFKIPRSKFSLSRKTNSENIVIFPKIPKRSKGRLAIESGGDESQVEWSQKPRKLFKPGKWASKTLYRWLELKLREEHGLRTTLMAEKMVIELQHAYLMVVNGHLGRALETVRDRSVELGLCTTELEFWSFIHKFMPFDFRMKVINMGGAFGSAIGPRILPYEAL